MKRLVPAFLCCLALLAAVPAMAGAATGTLDSYCTPKGDRCTSLVGAERDPVFVLRTSSPVEKYKLCFKQGRWERQCTWTWAGRQTADGYVSRVKLRRFFFFEPPGGHCTVSAFLGNAEVQIGRGLRFSWGRSPA
ncbi:MAG: hypothetical protein JST08_20965 [Actinobacteria bacterium]|nr:hypothetical protein [Actinomycetota bacterium]